MIEFHLLRKSIMGTAAALMGALRKVPAAAVPGLVDALRLTTQCSASSLLLDLLRFFPDICRQVSAGEPAFTHDKEEGEMDHTYLTALFHLLKDNEREAGNLEKVIWTVCVPLLRSRNPKFRSLQVEVAEMLAQAIGELAAWDAVQNSLAPLCLQSLNPILHRDAEFARDQPHKTADNQAWQTLEKKYTSVSFESTLDQKGELLSIYVVCELLGTLMAAALDASGGSDLTTKDMVKADGDRMYSAQKFCEEIVAIFLAPALSILAQPLDGSMRHCAVQNLLPSLLTSSVRFGWLNDVFTEERPVEARKSSLQEVWRCCQSLLSHGPSQRQDVYMALASFSDLLFPADSLSIMSKPSRDESNVDKVKDFDIRDEVHFWEELKTGLGDADFLTRKRALFVLRKALPGLHSCPVSATRDFHEMPRETNGSGKSTGPNSQKVSKRNKWAEKEAGFLGVGVVKDKLTVVDGWLERWNAFILLHETLEEYGIHLVEAAWTHQMSFLLQFTNLKGESKDASPYWAYNWTQKKTRDIDVNFLWISVLWQRGFDHKNPQVRRLVMQSFLDIKWEKIRKFSSLLPENVLLGPFLEALDDPVHHRDFGMKGNYSSITAEGAANVMRAYSASLTPRRRARFVIRLAKAVLDKNRGRAGLMTHAICLEASALGLTSGMVSFPNVSKEQIVSASEAGNLQSDEDPACLLDLLRNMAENCKHHFNPNYRAKVCGHVLRAACALVALPRVPFSKFAYFLSSFPKEHMIFCGSLHHVLMSWIQAAGTESGTASAAEINLWINEGLNDMAETFLKLPGFVSSAATDEDVEAWRLEADRWTRLLSLGLLTGIDCQHVISVIQRKASQIYSHAYMSACTPERVLLLLRSLLKEFTPLLDAWEDSILQKDSDSRTRSLRPGDKRISDMVLAIMDEVRSYARRSSVAFWEHRPRGLSTLPAAVSGKLGGRSQRRLPSVLTSAVLQGVLSISTLADCCLWCCRVGLLSHIPESVVTHLWMFAWEVVTTPRIMNEIDAELQLAALEAFTCACSALAETATQFYITAAHASLKFESKTGAFLPDTPDKMADGLLNALVKNVEDSAFVGALGRSRRAILYGCKWSSVDTLLSITQQSLSGHRLFRGEEKLSSAFSSSTLVGLFKGCIESLESAGEEYLLPLLRSIRWLMKWEVLTTMETDEDQDNKYQAMWALVQAGWSAMVDCNKRRVAPTAAFLSAIFNPAIFCDLGMHGSPADHEEYGPLKWLLNRLIDQGSRSPRTMRLTALHITGLWLLFPETTTFYMQELKKFSLYGGEAVDEELDGEILESHTAAREYATLIQSSDPELTEEFTNSEMFVRVTVAVMVHKLALMVQDSGLESMGIRPLVTQHARTFGQKYLLELLTAAAEDTDLNKELYKKKSAIHRRKVRVWQMLCILTPFLCREDLARLTTLLKKCLHRNNMPSVRQYIESFAAQLFLRFPELIEEHLILALHDYNMKTQALSSYVLIATYVLMGTPASRRKELLQQVLPAILPFMTSHHHNLRSFTQVVLIFRIIRQFLTSTISSNCKEEDLCLRSIAGYLEGNVDCSRMRTFVEKHLDAYDPLSSTTPRGIFCSRFGEVDTTKSAEDHPFECAPVAVLDQVALFLNEARDELRESMAADIVALTIEENMSREKGREFVEVRSGGKAGGQFDDGASTPTRDGSAVSHASDVMSLRKLDIQKKIASLRFSDSHTGEKNVNTSTVAGYDAEAELLLESIESRAKELIRMRGGRQDLIVVASLVGSVPNLAGLARTCEVFKASCLVVADASIAEDRQFQLISVTAEQWIPIVEVPEAGISNYLKRKRREGYSILGLEQTANSVSIDKYLFPQKVVLVLGRESDGIPVDIIQALDSCVEIPQLGVIRSLNVHVSGAIAVWEFTRQKLNQSLAE
ncbi:hypothetical protein Mapa_015217 [Marchantia paleacea]|nr:hypothetical protein Mapa_015217 [Marchantia paleacea]